MSTYTSKSRLFRISLPANWRVYEEGNTGITAVPEGGVAQSGNRTDIVYGAMVNHYDPFGESKTRRRSAGVYRDQVTLEDASNDLIAQIRQGSPHLSAIRGSSQRINVSGGQALAVSLRGTNPNTRIQERVTVVTRGLPDGHILYLLFVTPEREAQQYSRVLQAMVNSFQVSDAAH